MPDIFLSYSREDQATARWFAEGFEREGFSVWWDATLDAGQAYDEVTEKALQEARAVVVLWSTTSVASRWVRAEATQANDNKTLVPVMIESCKRPIMFELTHTADLSHWKGDPSDKVWRSYLAGLHRFVAKSDPTPAAAAAASSTVGQASTFLAPFRVAGRGNRIGVAAIVILTLLFMVGAILWVLTYRGSAQPPTQAGLLSEANVSLAVLPFVDMSPEHNQEYFADGLSEELLNSLAQIKELRVAGRTSSFSFKGKNEDLRVISEKLGVGNILEGSVRKNGTRLRITAQLINGKDGTHLWSQAFDREMTDVFAIQEEIATAVSGALSITLDVGQMSHARGGTTNLEAYDKYLQALKLFNQGGKREYTEAAQLFREAAKLDPAFARAWWGLRNALSEWLQWFPESAAAAINEMDEATARAVALAPDQWWTQAMNAEQFAFHHKWHEAEAAASAAMASAPVSEHYCGNFLTEVGRIREAVACFERVRQADPLSTDVSGNLQILLDDAGRPAEAQAEFERSKPLAGDHRQWEHFALFRLLAQKDADPATVKARFREFLNHGETVPMPLNRTLLDTLEDRQAAQTAIHRAFDDPVNWDQSRLAIIASYADVFGDRDLALAALRKDMVDLGDTGTIWIHFVTDLRADPRFKAILRDIGLADYYRTSGKWPDFCKPVGNDDFECH